MNNLDTEVFNTLLDAARDAGSPKEILKYLDMASALVSTMGPETASPLQGESQYLILNEIKDGECTINLLSVLGFDNPKTVKELVRRSMAGEKIVLRVSTSKILVYEKSFEEIGVSFERSSEAPSGFTFSERDLRRQQFLVLESLSNVRGVSQILSNRGLTLTEAIEVAKRVRDRNMPIALQIYGIDVVQLRSELILAGAKTTLSEDNDRRLPIVVLRDMNYAYGK